MPLEKQTIDIPFAGSLDTKSDSKHVAPGDLLLLENGTFQKRNKIQKRPGYDEYDAPASLGQGLSSFRDELISFGSGSVFTLNSQNGSWINKGKAQSVKNNVYSIVSNGFRNSAYDSFALNDKVGLITGFNGTSADYFFIDKDTKAIIDSGTKTTDYSSQAVSCGEYIYLFVNDASSLKVYRRSKNTPTIETTATPFSDVRALANSFTVNVYGTKMVISYIDTSFNLKLAYITQDMAPGSPANGNPSPITVAAATINTGNVYVSSLNKFFVFYTNAANDLKVSTYNDNFTAVATATAIEAGIGTTAVGYHASDDSYGTVSVYYLKNAGGSALDHIRKARINSSGAVASAAADFLINAKIVGNPIYWTSQAKHFTLLSLNSSVQPTIYMVDEDGRIVSHFLVGTAAPRTDKPCPWVLDGDTIYFVSREITDLAPQVGSSNAYVTDLITCDLDPDENFYTKEVGGVLQISGGISQLYDGVGVYENGFLHYPEYTAVPTVTASAVQSGTYLVYVIWEWIDNKGNVHRSSPGTPQSVVVPTSNTHKIDISIKNLHYTIHGGNAVIYCTQANGTIPYRVSTTATSTTTDYITSSITTNLTSYVANQILYTTGNVLDNATIPSARIIESYKDVLILAGLENDLDLWYSKKVTDGVSVSFNESFKTTLNALGGPIKAVKYMDDKLLVFKDSLIFAGAGETPNDLGQGGTFGNFELVSSDVGCPYPNSVVLTPDGVMFKSYKGFYLINRSLSVEYIGARVEDYNDLTVVSGDLLQDKNQIRFIHQDGECVVYDYFWKKWSVFTNHEAIDACVWKGIYTYMRADGFAVYYQNESSFKDSLESYKLKIGTAWIKLNGLQGYQRVQRVYLLGDYLSTHYLRVGVYYDYEEFERNNYSFEASNVVVNTAYGDSGDYGDESLYGGSDNGVYQFSIHLARQKCQAIRFVLEDQSPGDLSQSYSISDLSLEVGIKKGLNKLRNSKSL